MVVLWREAGGLAGNEPDEFVKFNEQNGGKAVFADNLVRVAWKLVHMALRPICV